MHVFRLRSVHRREDFEHVSKVVRSAEGRVLRWAEQTRAQPARLAQAVRSFDARRLPNLDSLNLRQAAIAVAIVAAVVLSAAWTIQVGPWARSSGVAVQAASPTPAPAPVIQGLAPKTTVRSRVDEQPIPVTGQQFVAGMSVTISTPDGYVTTYGSESLSNVSPTRFTLRAIFNVPGMYHLVVRTPAGTRSNEVSFSVDR